MPGALWTFDDFVAAAGGTGERSMSRAITGVSIDTRTLADGDVFVALSGERDGHDFVSQAFAAGASAALVREDYTAGPEDGALVRVADTLKALASVGSAARSRLNRDATVIAVTGSVGKTGTKDMIKACCELIGATHAADKSYNNHLGVPLTLARMPQESRFAVFEIGMNRAGEIAPLARLVRPHVAVVTTVGPVHLEFFTSVEAIAEAKSEILLGLEPKGTAVLNRDNEHFDLLAERAGATGVRIVSFGTSDRADVHASELDAGPLSSRVVVEFNSKSVSYCVGIPGAHIAKNSIAVAAVLAAIGADLETALPALAGVTALPGRGVRTVLPLAGGASILLIDESYNANPASVRAALAVLGEIPRRDYPRRIAVLGDMLELGTESAKLHAGLKEAVDAAGIDLIFASGDNMAHLYSALTGDRRGAWAGTSDELLNELMRTVRAGDAVMIKGSLGSRMAPLVAALKARFREKLEQL